MKITKSISCVLQMRKLRPREGKCLPTVTESIPGGQEWDPGFPTPDQFSHHLTKGISTALPLNYRKLSPKKSNV
jgi:hypothetical protein